MHSSARTSLAMTGSPASRSSIWRAASLTTPGVRSSGRWPRRRTARVRWIRPPAGVSCPRRSTSRLPAARSRQRATPSKSSSRSRPGTSDRSSRRARSRRRASCCWGRTGLRRHPRSWVDRGGCGLDNDLPYESARARLRYAEAIAAEGDKATAQRDLRAARTVFERLGATLDLQRVDALLGADQVPAASAERVTRTFMFTDIVTSTDLIGLVGDEAWAELLVMAQPGASVVLRKSPRRGSQEHWRRLLRDIRRRLPMRSSARSTSSGGWRDIAASTGSRPRADRSAHSRSDAGWP